MIWLNNRLSPLLGELGWETYDGFNEFSQGSSPLGRETKADVVLISRLRPALKKLNPQVQPTAIDQAIEELTSDRSRMSLVAANHEIYHLLKNGVRANVPDPESSGEEQVEVVRIIGLGRSWKQRFSALLTILDYWGNAHAEG